MLLDPEQDARPCQQIHQWGGQLEVSGITSRIWDGSGKPSDYVTGKSQGRISQNGIPQDSELENLKILNPKSLPPHDLFFSFWNVVTQIPFDCSIRLKNHAPLLNSSAIKPTLCWRIYLPYEPPPFKLVKSLLFICKNCITKGRIPVWLGLGSLWVTIFNMKTGDVFFMLKFNPSKSQFLWSSLDFCDPYGVTGSSVPSFPRQEYWVDYHFLLLGIFFNSGSNSCLLCLLHCTQMLYPWATGLSKTSPIFLCFL